MAIATERRDPPPRVRPDDRAHGGIETGMVGLNRGEFLEPKYFAFD